MMFLKVFVMPGAKREAVTEKGEMLTISVKEPARGNRANLRVREIVAEMQSVPLGKVRILTGHRSRVKMISITS